MNKHCILSLLLILVLGCVNQEVSTPGQVDQNSRLQEEFNEHKQLIEGKSLEVYEALTRWNTLVNEYNEGGSVIIENVRSAKEDYEYNGKILIRRLEDYRSFLDENGDNIEFTESSVLQEKSDVDELIIRMQANIKNIEASFSDIEEGAKTIELINSDREIHFKDEGDFRVIYSSPVSDNYLEYEEIFKESRTFENEARFLNGALILPYDVTIILTECGEENAFYDPNTKQIRLCYELVDHFATVFYGYSEKGTDVGQAILSTMYFAFYHEIGHTLIDIYDLPATGNSEDNADQVSTLILLGGGENGVNTLLMGANWFFIRSEESAVGESSFSDIHSPERRRYYNLLCWIYGNDPRGEYLITEWKLPEDRAYGCKEEYAKMSDSWNRLLAPYLKK